MGLLDIVSSMAGGSRKRLEKQVVVEGAPEPRSPGRRAKTEKQPPPAASHKDVKLSFGASPSDDGRASPASPAERPVRRASQGNVIFSSLQRTKSGRIGQKTPGPRSSKRAHVRTPSSPRVVEAYDRLLALRGLDGGLLEMQLRDLDDKAIQSLLDGLNLLDTVFNPVAALTMQRYGRGYIARRKYEASRRHEERPLNEGTQGEGGLVPLARGFQGCLVLGALNMDLKAEADATWPKQGTTTVGAFFASPGGKGGNEAVALACLGIPTHLVGQHGQSGVLAVPWLAAISSPGCI